MKKKRLVFKMILLLIVGLAIISPKSYNKTIEQDVKAASSCKTDIIWSQLGLNCAAGSGIDGNSTGTINFDTNLKVSKVEAYNLRGAEMKKLKGQYLLWALYNYMSADTNTAYKGGFNLYDNTQSDGFKPLELTLTDTEKMAYLNDVKDNIESYFSVDFSDSKYDTLEGISTIFLPRGNWEANVANGENYGLGEFERRIIAYDAILYQLDPVKFAKIFDYNYSINDTRNYYEKLSNNLSSKTLDDLIAMWDNYYAYTYDSVNRSMNIPLHSTRYSFGSTDMVQINMSTNNLLPTITNLTEANLSGGYYESVKFKHNLTVTHKYNSNDIYLDFVTGDYFVDWAADKPVTGGVVGTTQSVCPFGKWNSSVYFVPLKITYGCSEGTLVIKGIDENGNIVNGKQFRVVGDSYDETFTQSNSNPVTITLPSGDYTVTEISAPSGYELDKTVHNITITDNTQMVEFLNKYTSTNVTSPDTASTITMFVIAGLLIIGGGICLIIYSKKKKSDTL